MSLGRCCFLENTEKGLNFEVRKEIQIINVLSDLKNGSEHNVPNQKKVFKLSRQRLHEQQEI